MPRRLTPEETREAEECFAIYSKNGRLPIGDLGTALRSLGHNPGNSDLQKLMADIGSPSSLNLNAFKDVLARDVPQTNTVEEIREAFGVLDKDGNGTIMASELKHVLMTMGDRLSEEEVDIIIREVDIDGDGNIHYDQFIPMIKKH